MVVVKVSTRQKYLKQLGFYKGEIDGVEGKETKAAYLALQKRYLRPKDCDGDYGVNTDKVLINAIRVKKYTKNFTLEEVKCDCGGRYCSGYPAYLSKTLLKNLQIMRDKYGPITITCGMRCKSFNASLPGSIPTSYHIKGKALDIYIPGKTDTETSRLAVSKYFVTLSGSKFSYAYLPTKARSSLERNCRNMGKAVHIEVK